MMWLLACTAGVDDTGASLWGPGENEDEYGHPRPLLASCSMESDSSRSGHVEYTYDARGYLTVLGYQGYLDWEEEIHVTVIDDLSRPVSLDSTTAHGQYEYTWTYEGNTWRMLSSPDGDWTWTTDTTAEMWRNDACSIQLTLTEGLRLAERRDVCDRNDANTSGWRYSWEGERMASREQIYEGNGARYEYVYGPDRRLASHVYTNAVGYRDDRTYTWDCP
ncbi:MAG: hypothetical protein GY913_05520 [Proteobacteria bacterium]|nr:hypothetical protein [Pseudomonadota bacterium]MCP4916362.1 hypothetical protein [Pseudomonadota bacterium]